MQCQGAEYRAVHMVTTLLFWYNTRQDQPLRLDSALCSTTLDSRSPSRHTRPSARTHSKTDRKSPTAGLQLDNERMKAELQRMQKDIEEQMKDLQ